MTYGSDPMLSRFSMGTMGHISHWNTRRRRGTFTDESGKDYPINVSQILMPTHVSGEVDWYQSRCRLPQEMKGQRISALVEEGKVEYWMFWDEEFLERCMRPYRLIFRRGSERGEKPPEYFIKWRGYCPWKKDTLVDTRLYDYGSHARYFEQFSPELDRWIKVSDPR